MDLRATSTAAPQTPMAIVHDRLLRIIKDIEHAGDRVHLMANSVVGMGEAPTICQPPKDPTTLVGAVDLLDGLAERLHNALNRII